MLKMSLEEGLGRIPKAERVRPGKLENKSVVEKYPIVPAIYRAGSP